MKNKTLSAIYLALVIVTFASRLPGQGPSFTIHQVDFDIPGIHCVKVVDLDKDGDPDIVGGSEQTPYSASVGLWWWRNDGGSPLQWTKFVIDGTFLHVMSVDVNYIDPDSFPDIVASSWANGKITWWKNSGNPETGWSLQDVVTGLINPHDAVCSDIDADGDADIVGVSSGNNTISVFYNQGETLPTWQESVVTSGFGSAKSVIVEDLNNDSLPDLVGAGDGCDDIAWWENTGGIPIAWIKHTITAYFNGASGLDAVDMNNDGQQDILGTGWEGNEVSFWICNDIAANSWTQTMVTDQLEIAAGAMGADFDLDDDIDIVAVGKIPGELALFVNDLTVFTQEVLFPGFAGGSALEVTDLDQDGDDDIIAGAGVLKELYWFENLIVNASLNPENVSDSFLKVIPNPSAGEFDLCIPVRDGLAVTVRICDLSGAVIHQQTTVAEKNKIHVTATGRKRGIYVIRLVAGNTSYYGKIVIRP